jgi:soluble lytic murein transglycosylase-like protein
MSRSASVYRPQIERIAGRYDLDPVLVEAVVWTESTDHTDAFRPEPNFYRRYLKGKPEWAGWVPRRISSSYGLMQVMYTTAILNGWAGEPRVARGCAICSRGLDAWPSRRPTPT